jgi:histidine decarboxylase
MSGGGGSSSSVRSSSLTIGDQLRISVLTVAIGITSISILNALSYMIRRRGVSFLNRPLPAPPAPLQAPTVSSSDVYASTGSAKVPTIAAAPNRQSKPFKGRDFDASSFTSGRVRTASQSSFPSFLSPGFNARHPMPSSANATGGKMDPLSLLDEDDGEEEEEEEQEENNVGTEKVYQTKLQLQQKDLTIGESALDDATINLQLSRLLEHLKQRTAHHLGYPYNLQFKSDGLVPFLQFSINNLGDPFKTSNYGVHSREFEISVLEFFASMWDLDLGNYWGYITTCGTEGNLLGILYGREKFAPARNGILYCSKETHYSVPKAAVMYQMPIELCETNESGELLYSDLEEKLSKHKNEPAIVSVNAGTTVKGAYDVIDKVVDVLKRVGIKRENFYIHVDGALNGLILPFLSKDCEPSRITFDKPIDSVSVSGHKMLGCPMPCGVVITRIEHMQRWGKDVEYLNSTDTTIMGSRNGQAALAMWVALQRKGLDGIRAEVVQCIDNAKYLKELFDKSGVKCMLNEFSTTVVFERPPENVVQKWQLACKGDIAHVVVMPSVSKAKLRRFHRDVMQGRKAPPDTKSSTPVDDSTYRMVSQ